eukprot:8071495-Pyramimonas_sp.AAC.1
MDGATLQAASSSAAPLEHRQPGLHSERVDVHITPWGFRIAETDKPAISIGLDAPPRPARWIEGGGSVKPR